jgi:hypothetical protein
MLRKTLLTTGLLMAVLLPGSACRSNADKQRASEKAQEVSDKAEVLARQAETKATEMREKAVEKADQAADEAGKAAAEARAARDEFVARSNAKLIELDARIAELEAKAGARTDQAAKDAIVTLKKMRLDASNALESARTAGQTDWARVTATFDATYDKVAAAAEDVARKLNLTEKNEKKK